MGHLNYLIIETQSQQDLGRAVILQKFFQTQKGGYGEGDIFLGLRVPVLRDIAKKYYPKLDFNDLEKLLDSPIHEFRAIALVILNTWMQKASNDAKIEESIVVFYIKNKARINGRDLVDISAPTILGKYILRKKDYIILYKLAESDSLRDRRIAIVSTLTLIKKNIFDPTLELAEMLLDDKHHLIHKAVGWMLREVGKRNLSILEDFLDEHSKKMPRIMLSYAMEKLPEHQRKAYRK